MDGSTDNRIVVLGYQKPTLTERCLASALAAGYPESALLLVDNGSFPGSYAKLEQRFSEIGLCRLETNRGYAGGWNAGMRQALKAAPVGLFFASNDCEFQAGVVEACASLAQETGAALVAPRILERRNPERIHSYGGHFHKETYQLEHYQEAVGSAFLGDGDYVPGSAFWISAEVLQRLGGMDESYFCYWEDVDYSTRARAAGFKLARCNDATLLHEGRGTTGKKPLYTTYYYWRNRIRFCRQHLSAEAWENARRQLGKELVNLEKRWAARQDSLRLAYLPALRSALHPE